jgi:hypothetical protein
MQRNISFLNKLVQLIRFHLVPKSSDVTFRRCAEGVLLYSLKLILITTPKLQPLGFCTKIFCVYILNFITFHTFLLLNLQIFTLNKIEKVFLANKYFSNFLMSFWCCLPILRQALFLQHFLQETLDFKSQSYNRIFVLK